MPQNLAYFEPSGSAQAEEKIQRSLFIARVELCRDEAAARDFLSRVRTEHRDATHNCWAYILGPGAEDGREARENASDDGEPSGTAGRPILGAIKRRGLMNAMVVVTRYFGGVKLGVRGLIEAYGGVAARALDAVRAVERVPSRSVTLRLPWGSVGEVTRLLKTYAGGDERLRWDYGSPDGDVIVSADVPLFLLEPLTREVATLRAQEILRAEK